MVDIVQEIFDAVTLVDSNSQEAVASCLFVEYLRSFEELTLSILSTYPIVKKFPTDERNSTNV